MALRSCGSWTTESQEIEDDTCRCERYSDGLALWIGVPSDRNGMKWTEFLIFGPNSFQIR